MLEKKIVQPTEEAKVLAKAKATLPHAKQLDFAIPEFTKAPVPLVDVVVVEGDICAARILGWIRNVITDKVQDRIHSHRLDEDCHATRLEDPADLAPADIGSQMVQDRFPKDDFKFRSARASQLVRST